MTFCLDFSGHFCEDGVMDQTIASRKTYAFRKNRDIKKRPHKDETLWGGLFRW